LTPYVVDASVAAKWFLPSSGELLTAEAVAIQNDMEGGRRRVLVPDLFWAEMGNVLWKAARQRRMSPAASEEALDLLQQSAISTAPSQPLLRDALNIATVHNRSFYDSLYVALARAADALLVTADERLANALAARFPIRWLGAL